MCAKALSLGQQAGAHLTFLNGLAIRDVIIDGCASFNLSARPCHLLFGHAGQLCAHSISPGEYRAEHEAA